MSKRKSKAITKTNKTKAKSKSITKASAAKAAVTKSAVPGSSASPLIVLGYDEQQKPRGARFVDAKPDLVAKAADLMDLKVYQATSEDVAAIAKKLPVGRLYANGRGFVPNVRQDLYSDLVVALALEPQAALSPENDKDNLPAARGLPRTWDEVGPGHLVIAQESLDYGWWEAIIIERKDDVFLLRFRDYPKLPKFFRHQTAIALMYSPTEEAKPAPTQA
jgi:hypothetical protein